MRISRRWILSSAALGAAELALPRAAHAMGELRLSSFLARGHFVDQQVLQPFADQLAKEGVSVSLFHAGELAGAITDQLRLIEAGVADLALVVPTLTPGRFPEMSFVSLPNLIPDATTGSRLLTRMYFEGSKDGMFEFGQTLPIGYFVTPPYFLHAAKEIKGLGDLAGLRVRAHTVEIGETLKLLGAVPEMVSYLDVLQAVTNGAVDAAALSRDQYRALDASRVLPYSIDLNLGGSSAVLLVMQRERFNWLPDYEREVIMKAGGTTLAENWGAAYDREAPRTVAGFSSLDAIDAQNYAETAERVHEQWIEAGRSERRSVLEEAKRLLTDIASGVL